MPRSRGQPGTPSASSPRPQQHQDGGRGAAAGPGLRLRAVRLPSSGSSRDMALERDPRSGPKGRRLRGAAGQRLRSWAQPGPAPGPPDARPGRPTPCTRRARAATASQPCPLRFPQAVSPGKLSAPRPGPELGAGGRCGRAGASRLRRGGAGELGERVFQRDESPRAALLRRRPPPPAAFPPSGLTPASLGRAAAPSKQPRRDNQAGAAAATPSGGARDRRAGRQRVGGELGGATQAHSRLGGSSSWSLHPHLCVARKRRDA